jgi:hypothetical protein
VLILPGTDIVCCLVEVGWRSCKGAAIAVFIAVVGTAMGIPDNWCESGQERIQW